MVDLRFWNFEWPLFFYDARRAPVILALGKLWSCDWTCPFVQIPLGLITRLWLISVLNITWESVWNNTSTFATEVAYWGFRILDDIFGQSQFSRAIFFVVVLYLAFLGVGGCILGAGQLILCVTQNTVGRMWPWNKTKLMPWAVPCEILLRLRMDSRMFPAHRLPNLRKVLP